MRAFFLFLCAVVGSQAATPPRAFELHEEPELQNFRYDVIWKGYRVTVERSSDVQHRFRIWDRAGHVLREIRAPFIHFVRFANLTGRAAEGELLVLAAPLHNTIGDRRLYAFTRLPRLRNVLAMPEGYDELRDLDQDGRPEIILAAAYPFEWRMGGHRSPTVAVVLRWEQARYVVRTRRYPGIAREMTRRYREEFQKRTAAWEQLEVVPGGDLYATAVAAAGYWASRAVLGEDRAAASWVRPKLPLPERENFGEHLDQLRQGLREIPRMIRTDQRRVIVVE